LIRNYIFSTNEESPIQIVEKQIQYIPALFKLFDEGIVNCRDHAIRMEKAVKDDQENNLPVKNIDITKNESRDITSL